MFFELELALRFLRGRRRSLARFTSYAAIAGIAAGVASLILAQALARGFQAEMQEKVIGNAAHISVFRDDQAPLENWENLKSDLANLPRVRSAEITKFESAIINGNIGSSYAMLHVSDHNSGSGADTVAVGVELAKRCGVSVGDQIEVIAFGSGEPKAVKLRVGRLMDTGLFEFDSTQIALTPKLYAATIGEGTFTPTSFSVFTDEPAEAETIAQNIRQVIGDGHRVISWQEANRPLFAALTLEKRAALAVIMLIILIAALNITTTLSLLVNEHRPDIAVLRTCGAKAKSLIAVFLIEGVLLSVTGIVLGILIGLAGCFLANYFELISLSPEVYSISSVMLRPTAGDVLLAAVGAFAIGLLASVYPAYKSSGVKPLDNLKV